MPKILLFLQRFLILFIFLFSGREYFAQCTGHLSGNIGSRTISAGQTLCTSGTIEGSITVANGGTLYLQHDFDGVTGAALTVQPGGKVVVCGNPVKIGGNLTVSGTHPGGQVILTAGSYLDMAGGSITAAGTNHGGANPAVPFAYQGSSSCYAQVHVRVTKDDGGPNQTPSMGSTNGGTAWLTESNNLYFSGKPIWFSQSNKGNGRIGNAPSFCSPVGSCSPCASVNAGSIGGGNQVICAGTSATTITNTSSASGGDGSSYSYQWRVSVNGGAYSNASGSSTGATYSPGVLPVGVYDFKRKVTSSGCGSATTSTIRVTVNVVPTVTGSTGASRCANGTANINATASTGSIRWYASGGSFLGNSTSGANWTTPSVNTTTTYYAEATTGSCNSPSRTAVTVNVTPALSAGSIASNQDICYNTIPAALTSSPASGGSGTYNYQWQISTTDASSGFANIGVTSESYNPPSTLTQDTWYRREVISGACGPLYTSSVSINVYDDLQAGSIGTNQKISSGTIPDPFTSSVAASGGGGFTYQWQTSTDGGFNFFNIIGANSITYAHPSVLYHDTKYRRAAISISGCGTVYTDVVSVIPVVAVCSGEAPPDVIEQTGASGGVGGYTYQWQSSEDGVTFTDIPGETSVSLSPVSLSNNLWYRRAVISGGCIEYTTAVQAKMNTRPGGVGDELLVWLEADKGTGNIGTKWEDQSGNANHYTTVSGPTLNLGSSSSNYNPFVEITSGGFNAPVGAELGDEYTIICVAEKIDSDNDGRIFDGHTGNYSWGYWGQYSNSLNTNNNPSKQSTGPATNTHQKGLQSFIRKSNGDLEHRVNGASVGNYTGSASASGVRVDINQGAFAGNENSDSRIYEFIIYNSVLTSEEISIVESYLMTKYALANTSHNYMTSFGAMSFDVSSYNNDIIGIGKECFVHQKQSGSGDDSTQIFISSLAANNTSNTGSVTNDISYLYMGHNGGKLSIVDTEKPAVIGNRLEREWKLTNTNFSDNFSIEIEYQDLGVFTLADLRLLVDDDGDFSDATVYSAADGITFNYGSIIIGGLGPSIFGMGTTSFFTLGVADNVLPINMVGFKAIQTEKAVELTWTTLSETNNEYFSVQKLNEGTNEWYQIEKLPGQDFSDHNIDYIVYDEKGCEGQCYYRLVQVDHDGTTTISDVITISDPDKDAKEEIQLTLFPNPSEDILYINLRSPIEGNYTIKVYQTDGRLIMNTKGELHYGKQTISINVHDLEHGLYYIDFTDDIGRKRSSATFNRK